MGKQGQSRYFQKVRSQVTVDQDEPRDDGQRRTDAPACPLENQEDGKAADDQIGPVRGPGPQAQGVEFQENVQGH